MNRSLGTVSLLAALLLCTSGCDTLTAPKLEEFHWQAVDNPDQITEGIDAAAFAGEIILLGQLKTPSLCFRLDSRFERSGSTLILRVTATSTDAPTCNQTPGGYQYTGALRHLERGTYTVRAIHSVPGSEDKEYSETVTL